MCRTLNSLKIKTTLQTPGPFKAVLSQCKVSRYCFHFTVWLSEGPHFNVLIPCSVITKYNIASGAQINPRSFTILADKVNRGLRVFNKVFTERAEVLWQSVIRLHAIADDISNFHHKAKIAGITGGTTTAVGGVTAIAGLALAPFTFGASLVITAVGVGVATAGGITSASAAISDNVNNMHDRKKVSGIFTMCSVLQILICTIGYSDI